MPKNFVVESFTVAVFLGNGELWLRSGGGFKIFRGKFFASQRHKISQGNTLLFHYFWVTKNFMLQRVMSRFSIFCRKFFVSQCQISSQVNPFVLLFRKYRVAKKLMDQRGGGEYQGFPREIFCLTVPKKFVGESITVPVFLGTGKVWIRKREYQEFPWKIFCFTLSKNFLGESFSVSLVSGIEKFYASEGYVTIFDFLSKVYFLTVPKVSVGESFTVALISGTEEVWIRGGGEYQDIP